MALANKNTPPLLPCPAALRCLLATLAFTVPCHLRYMSQVLCCRHLLLCDTQPRPSPASFPARQRQSRQTKMHFILYCWKMSSASLLPMARALVRVFMMKLNPAVYPGQPLILRSCRDMPTEYQRDVGRTSHAPSSPAEAACSRGLGRFKRRCDAR